MAAAVLAIDGGNSKTDAALIGYDGSVLGYARGSGSSHQNVGLDASMAILTDLVRNVAAEAGFDFDTPLADHAAIYLAGADLPTEIEMLSQRLTGKGWAKATTVDNDTFALLRTGAVLRDCVAVVCGAGINCVGRSATGECIRFPSLGQLSGDWGGGAGLSREALWLAVRDEDGRGSPTALRDAIRNHFGFAAVSEVSAAFHLGELPLERIHELTPIVFQVATSGDPAAVRLVVRMAEEVVLLAVAALRRLDLLSRPADVVLGGGVLAARHPLLLRNITSGLAASAPHAVIRIVDDPPIIGAALLGLDTLGITPSVQDRVRDELCLRAGASGYTRRTKIGCWRLSRDSDAAGSRRAGPFGRHAG